MQKRDNEINISLDSYNDIFSDFDPRPYKLKALSVDFLDEARRASRYNTPLNLKFFLPADKRNMQEEKIIKKRLSEHFRKHYDRLEKERRQLIKQGLGFVFLGIIFMLLSTVILMSTGRTFLADFLAVLFQPAGWFLFWEGAHLAVFDSRMKKTDYDFYRKMSKCSVTFLHYK